MQEELFHEDINAALGHVIAAIGGMKHVGVELWPTLTADKGGRKVADCLNSDRAQQFHPDELVWILCEARKKGVHTAMAFLAGECGYSVQPIEPEDEAAKLQREFVQAQESLQQMLKRMEKLALPSIQSVA